MSGSSLVAAYTQGVRRRAAAVAVVSLLLGILTAYAQGWLPHELGSLANSTGPWTLVAFSLALTSSSGRQAAMFGSLSLLGLLLGYFMGADLLSAPSSTTTLVFWGAAALLAGPLLGLGAYWVKTDERWFAATGAGAISGVLIGEGLYGLRRIADTTYPPYWRAEILIGLVLWLAIALRRLRGVRAIAVSAGVTAMATGAFVLVYGRGSSGLLP